MSHTASGWQKGPLLEWRYNVFFVRGRVRMREREREGEKEQQRQPTGFSVPRHVLVGQGVRLLMKCVGRSIQVHLGRRTTCEAPDVCVYLSPTSSMCVHCTDESTLHLEEGRKGVLVTCWLTVICNNKTYCTSQILQSV